MRSVLFATQTAATQGGVERWLSDVAAGLRRAGWRVMVGLADGPTYHDAGRYLRAYPEIASLPHWVLRRGSGLPSARRRALTDLLEETRPDVVVPVMLHDTLGACRARRLSGQRLHLLYPIHENEFGWFDAVAEHTQVVDAVVSVNRLMLDALEKFIGWPRERAFHAPHGVQLSAEAGKRFRPGAPVRIGYCGKLLDRPKRVFDLVPICEELQRLGVKVDVTFAGSGRDEEELRRRLRARVELGTVRFLGSLDREELARTFYPELDVLVVPSESESGPLVAWEAMSHGLLVLSSEYTGLRREGILRDDETAIVFPVGQPIVAARRLQEALGNPAEARRVAERGRTVAAERLEVSVSVGAWEAVLERVMDLPPRPMSVAAGTDCRPGWKERTEDILRVALRRPLMAGTWQEEWPRFRPGAMSEESRSEFAGRLRVLEAELVGESRPRSDVAQSRLCPSATGEGERS
jgi:glycosyltransferase involved in cell wall biosynthesis